MDRTRIGLIGALCSATNGRIANFGYRMCLHDDELFLLIFFFAPQLAQLGVALVTPDVRAHLRVDLRSAGRPLLRAVLFTLPAAGVIKLFHDWVGLGHRSVCMSRAAFLVICLLLCAAVELGWHSARQVETDAGLDLSERYRVRFWTLNALLGAARIALFALIPFK